MPLMPTTDSLILIHTLLASRASCVRHRPVRARYPAHGGIEERSLPSETSLHACSPLTVQGRALVVIGGHPVYCIRVGRRDPWRLRSRPNQSILPHAPVRARIAYSLLRRTRREL